MEFQRLAAVTLNQLQLHLAVEGLGDAFSWLLYQVSKVSEYYTVTSFLFSVFPRKIMQLVTYVWSTYVQQSLR